MIKRVKRGEVYLANLDYGYCEVLVIQNNKGNFHSPTTIVLEIKNNIVNYLSARTIDKVRLIKKLRNFNTYQMTEVNKKLLVALI